MARSLCDIGPNCTDCLKVLCRRDNQLARRSESATLWSWTFIPAEALPRKLFLGICSVMGSTLLPQTNALVEWFNRTLVYMLSKRTTNGSPDLLPHVLFAYRSSPQVSNGEFPFRLLYMGKTLNSQLNVPPSIAKRWSWPGWLKDIHDSKNGYRIEFEESSS